jgi:hypothetical protein
VGALATGMQPLLWVKIRACADLSPVQKESISLWQFRNGRQIKAWLLAGETIELIERRQVVARIVPKRGAGASKDTPDSGSKRKRPNLGTNPETCASCFPGNHKLVDMQGVT